MLFLKEIIQVTHQHPSETPCKGFLRHASQINPSDFWNGTRAGKQLMTTGQGLKNSDKNAQEAVPGIKGPAPEEGAGAPGQRARHQCWACGSLAGWPAGTH